MRGFLCAVAGVVALTAAPALAETVIVKVGHNRLDPSEVTVQVGSAVTFRNEDPMPGGHSVVAADGSFESPGLAVGEDWSHTFEKAGRHSYTIKEHPTTMGTIIVEE